MKNNSNNIKEKKSNNNDYESRNCNNLEIAKEKKV